MAMFLLTVTNPDARAVSTSPEKLVETAELMAGRPLVFEALYPENAALREDRVATTLEAEYRIEMVAVIG